MLRLLTYNIRFGGTGREAALAETIHAAAADVVVLQEATRPDVVGDLAERTGMKLWAASPLHSVGFMSRIDVDHTWLRPPPWIHVSRAPLELLVPGRMRVLGAHLSAV